MRKWLRVFRKEREKVYWFSDRERERERSGRKMRMFCHVVNFELANECSNISVLHIILYKIHEAKETSTTF